MNGGFLLSALSELVRSGVEQAIEMALPDSPGLRVTKPADQRSMTASHYELDPRRLDDAIRILEAELAVTRPFFAQRRRLVPYSQRGLFVVSGLAALIFVSWNHAWLSDAMAPWALGVFVGVPFAVVQAIGLGQLPAFRRIRHTQARLGIERARYLQFVGWTELRRRALVFAPLLFCTLMFPLSVVLDWNPLVQDAWCVAFAVAFASAFSHVERRNEVWQREIMGFDESERLLKVLLEHKAAAADAPAPEPLGLSAADYRQIARIERALVGRERLASVRLNARRTRTGRQEWVVLQSAAVMDQKSRLDPSTRLQVQDWIDELSANPRPAGAVQDADGVWWAPVPGTDRRVAFFVTPDANEVLVRDLLPRASPANSGAPEPVHG